MTAATCTACGAPRARADGRCSWCGRRPVQPWWTWSALLALACFGALLLVLTLAAL